MRSPSRQVKPTRKPSLGAPAAAFATTLVLLPYLAWHLQLLDDRAVILFTLALMLAAPIAIYRTVFVERERPPIEGRRLVFRDGFLRQFDADREVARIDATRDFQYRVLDRYDPKRAVFRLHQADTELTFRISDPGGDAAVKDVVQIQWPPRSRHAGRSYPPSDTRPAPVLLANRDCTPAGNQSRLTPAVTPEQEPAKATDSRDLPSPGRTYVGPADRRGRDHGPDSEMPRSEPGSSKLRGFAARSPGDIP